MWTSAASPFSYLQTTNWPVGNSTSFLLPQGFDDFEDFMTSIHEFGHCQRQTVDGNLTHFLDDSINYVYARKHDYCGGPTGYHENQGFAFNEGWADYWSGEPRLVLACPNDTANPNIEGTVSLDLEMMSLCPGVGRHGMFQVLLSAGTWAIHSDADFRRHYQQNFPNCPLPTPLTGGCNIAEDVPRFRFVPPSAIIARPPDIGQVLTNVRRWRNEQAQTTARLSADLESARSAARSVGTCAPDSCAAVAQQVARPAILAGQVAMSRMLEDVLAEDDRRLSRGDLRLPRFDPGFDLARRVRALRFEQDRAHVIIVALEQAIAAISAREAEDRTGHLAGERAQLERVLRLLRVNHVADDTLLSFVKMPALAGDDDAKQMPSGFAPSRPKARYTRWWPMLPTIVFCLIIVLLVARQFRSKPARAGGGRDAPT
jgi:hypothetical protein